MPEINFDQWLNEPSKDQGPPDDRYCYCDERDPDDHTLSIDEGAVTVTHTACSKPIDDDGYSEVWTTSEPIPIQAKFVDLGWSPSTPESPAEHNGYWWELSPRR